MRSFPRLTACLLALLSGGMLAVIYAPFSFWPIAWFALVPVYSALCSTKTPLSFAGILGFLLGMVQFGIGCAWLHDVGFLPWLFVAVAEGAFTAVFAVLFVLLSRRITPPINPANPEHPVHPIHLIHRALLFASLWTLLETARFIGTVAFPWLPLAASQTHCLPVLQIVSVTGQAGLSFALALVNALWGESAIAQKTVRLRLFAIGSAIPILLAIYGMMVLTTDHTKNHTQDNSKNHIEDRIEDPTDSSAGSLTIALIQGNLKKPSRKLTLADRQNVLAIYRSLTEQAANQTPKPQLILWPETVVPGLPFRDASLSHYLGGLAIQSNAALLVGTPDSDPTTGNRYNSAALFLPDGTQSGRYDKRRLVPGGEYKPLKTLLAGLYRSQGAPHSEWTKGDAAQTGILSVPTAQGNIPVGVLICYESIFGSESAIRVRNGAQILTMLTSDQVFGKSAGPKQHADMAILRAVETRRPICRVATTGVSRIIDAYGDTVSQIGVDEQGVRIATMFIRTDISPYVRFGDYFPYGCLLIVCFLTFSSVWQEKKRKTLNK